MIEIIPAIDIIDGQCVRLSQGDYSRKDVYTATPVEMARLYHKAGIKRLHIVDLDGAKKGKPCNIESLKKISGEKNFVIEWGGGIKTGADLETVFNAGADCAIIGSLAVKEPSVMRDWLERYGGKRIILGADIRAGKVAVNGWLDDSNVTIENLIEHYIPYGLKEVICTDISKDGMLQGPSTNLYIELQNRYPDIIFTVSGGISSIDDIKKLDDAGLRRVIVGKAIYENRILLDDLTQFIKTPCRQKE